MLGSCSVNFSHLNLVVLLLKIMVVQYDVLKLNHSVEIFKVNFLNANERLNVYFYSPRSTV